MFLSPKVFQIVFFFLRQQFSFSFFSFLETYMADSCFSLTNSVPLSQWIMPPSFSSQYTVKKVSGFSRPQLTFLFTVQPSPIDLLCIIQNQTAGMKILSWRMACIAYAFSTCEDAMADQPMTDLYYLSFLCIL